MTATCEQNSLDRIAERAGRLYSLPAVAMDVLRLTSCPKVDVPALKACIENDPALATKVMRVVNSSIFGLASQVSDLGQALALLGTKPLKMLVLGFSLPTGMNSKGRRGAATRHVLTRYWRTTLIKAVAARRLAQTSFEQDGDEAFLIALLEDLGMMVLIEQFGDTYADLVAKVWRAGGDLAQLERESLGFEHRELSVRLLQVWGLPENLVAPLADQNNETSETSQHILQLAGLFARLLVDGRPERLEQLRRMSREIDVLRADRLDVFVSGLQQQVSELAQVLGLDTPEEPDYAQIIKDAHRQLAAVASDVAIDLLDAHRTERHVAGLLDEVQMLSHAVNGSAQHGIRLEDVATKDAEYCEQQLTDPGLLGRVQAAAAECRRSRRPLSLLVIELNQTPQHMLASGVNDATQIDRLSEICQRLGFGVDQWLALGDHSGSLILTGSDRRRAKDLFREIEAEYGLAQAAGETLSAGLAVANVLAKNFAAADLIDAAYRCVRAARHSGSSLLKTIEIC